MSPIRRFTWQKVLAFVPVLMLMASLPSQMLMRCRMDGLVRTSCCCPVDKNAGSQAHEPLLKAQACCDREVATHVPPTVATTVPARAPHEESLSIAVVLSPSTSAWNSLPARLSPPRVFRGHGPPRSGPGIVVLKHAFLI
ncbi:MAG: hypothetical protein H7X95_10010 [Deltaproteobacteria bacterium]|nr:hypothetical protein [Deltaproteobacteria bacterium]